MSDKKYVQIIIGTVVSLLLIIYLLILLLPEERYMDNDYPYFIQQKNYITAKGDKREILLLGDSLMKTGAIPAGLGEDVYNLALPGGTSIEMYYTLKTYLEHHPIPKAVIIGFEPYHYAKMLSYDGAGLYYHYYDEETVVDFNRIILEKDGKDFSSESILYKFKVPYIYMKPILRSIVKPRTAENRKKYDLTGKAKGKLFYGDSDNKERKAVFPVESKDKTFIPLKSLTYFTEELLRLCQENNIPVYLEQLPLGNPGYKIAEDSGYFDGYKTFLKALHDKYPEAVINYEIPLYEARFFRDDSHLNTRGAEKYTKELKEKYPHLFTK